MLLHFLLLLWLELKQLLLQQRRPRQRLGRLGRRQALPHCGSWWQGQQLQLEQQWQQSWQQQLAQPWLQ